MKPFGPVDNGSQHLYGLDYKSAMWRGDEENPFHTEVGYWLWDPATGEVMRGSWCLGASRSWPAASPRPTPPSSPWRPPRAGRSTRSARTRYLAKNASTLSYKVTVTTGNDTWSYDEVTMLQMKEFEEPFAHTDHNTMRRVG